MLQENASLAMNARSFAKPLRGSINSLLNMINLQPATCCRAVAEWQLRGAQEAVEAARQAVALGADMLDIGGQSTRPHATRLSAAQECSRIIPAIR